MAGYLCINLKIFAHIVNTDTITNVTRAHKLDKSGEERTRQQGSVN